MGLVVGSIVVATPEGRGLGDASVLLVGRGRRHEVEGFAGPLSIKSVRWGRVTWRTDEGEHVVDETSLAVLDDGQPYSLAIDAPRPVETCVVFFRRGLVESLGAALADEAPRAIRVRPRLHGNGELLERVRGLHGAAASGSLDALALEERVLELAGALVALEQDGRRVLERLDGVRESTRAEIFRRLGRARDYLHAHYRRPLALADVARAAWLSEFHFHRQFTRAFGVTPRAYLNELRLQRAAFLLRERGAGVGEACRAVGFASPSSFGHLFRRRFGVRPSAWAQPSKRRPIGPRVRG